MNPLPTPDSDETVLGLNPAALLARAGSGARARIEAAGDRLGPYVLIERLGEGGMGVVWLAEQEEPVRRRVALKIIKLGMDTSDVVARFEQERQALAMMDHPAIARVLDAGITESGRPFFVMEAVPGVPLTSYCDEHRLDVRQRLLLFIKICQAVQHAHQKGIIHRDLKPSNILVSQGDGGEPMPKVIDFGIAKATGPALKDLTALTHFAQVLGTPAYMSPEQAGLKVMDIDTRSDIYSLGVVLYELLTGRPPFESRQLVEAGMEEMRRIIREKTPPRPSTRILELGEAERTGVATRRKATAGRVTTAVRGDLDWIVMKALEKDRARRYETVGAMAADLQRHLENQPVQARPPGAAYLLSRFVRRHRIGFAAGTAVVLALISGISAAVWGFLRAESERDKARLARGSAEGLINSMLYDLRDKLKPVGRLDLLEDVSLQAEQYFDTLPPEELTPAVLHQKASMLINRGSVLTSLGRLPEAKAYFERALHMAQERTEANPGDQQPWIQIATCYNRLSHISQSAGDLPAARAASEKEVVISEQLVRDHPEDWKLTDELAMSLDRLGEVELVSGNPDAAGSLFTQALTLREQLASSRPDDHDRQRSVVVSCSQLAEVAQDRGDLAAARSALDRGIAIMVRLTEAVPKHAGWQSDLATLYAGAAGHAKDAGDLQQAEDLQLKGLDVLKLLVGQDPANPGWKRALANGWSGFSDIVSLTKGAAAAETAIRKATAILEEQMELDPVGVSWQTDLARALQRLSDIERSRRNADKAGEAANRAVAIMERVSRRNPQDADNAALLAECHVTAGVLLARREDGTEAALAAFEKARAARERLAQRNPADVQLQRGLAECHMHIGIVLSDDTRDLSGARQNLEKALGIVQLLADSHPADLSNRAWLCDIWANLARLARAEKNSERELAAWEKMRETSEAISGAAPDNLEYLENWYVSLREIADIEKAAGDAGRAKELRKQAAVLLRDLKARGAPLGADDHLFLLKEDLSGE